MCAFAMLIQKPGIVWDKTCKLEDKLVSEFLNVTIYIVHLQSSYLIEYPSFSECSISAPFFKKKYVLAVAVCHVFPSYHHCPCPVVAFSVTVFFPFPAFTLGRTLDM